MADDVSFLLADALTLSARPAPAMPPGVTGDYRLPPLEGHGGTSGIDAAAMASIARLYLLAELENAALVTCADAVAEQRSTIRSTFALAQKLEQYAELARRSPASSLREELYARWFGLGAQAGTPGRTNGSFLSTFSEFASAVASLANAGTIGASPRSFGEERARVALGRLLQGLSLLGGSELLLVPRFEALVSSAVGVLSDADLAALLGVQGLTGVVNTLVGGVATELTLAYRRGRTGEALLRDCARLAPRTTGSARLVDAADPIVAHAVQWLASYGFGGSPS